MFYPPSAVGTAYCQCPEWHGEVWTPRDGMMVCLCRVCRQRLPLMRQGGGR